MLYVTSSANVRSIGVKFASLLRTCMYPNRLNDCPSTLNLIFKYNGYTKYSVKDLKIGILVTILNEKGVCLNEKGLSVKIQLLNIFRDNHIVSKSGPTTIDYDNFIH